MNVVGKENELVERRQTEEHGMYGVCMCNRAGYSNLVRLLKLNYLCANRLSIDRTGM